MSKKAILVLAGIFLFFGCNVAWANVVINEIMYDLEGTDAKREWIEIYNPAGAAVNITGDWRFYDGSSHLMNNKDTFTIPANGFVVLASDKDTFITEHSGFTSIVVDTVMSLGNTGGTIKVLNADGSAADTAVYSSSTGANGDGKSLQKKSGSWVAALPTPGKENEITDSASSLSEENNSVSAQNTNETNTIGTPKIKTKITASKIIFAGIPAEFGASATGYSNESLIYGKYFWNFGDGSSQEMKTSDAAKFTHTFFYEGDYTVTLQYFQNYYSVNPDAMDEVNIKVIKADISISKIGDAQDFFIEVSNNTGYDADISNWILSGVGKNFIFPKNTILGSKKKIMLSPQVTGFSFADKNNLKLTDWQGKIISSYGASVKTVRNAVKTYAPEPAYNDSGFTDETDENNFTTKLPTNSLLAQAAGSGAGMDNNFEYGIFGLLAFVGLSAGAAYFIRRHNRKPGENTTGDDFEIIDE